MILQPKWLELYTVLFKEVYTLTHSSENIPKIGKEYSWITLNDPSDICEFRGKWDTNNNFSFLSK